jgi:hypothetical protein
VLQSAISDRSSRAESRPRTSIMALPTLLNIRNVGQTAAAKTGFCLNWNHVHALSHSHVIARGPGVAKVCTIAQTPPTIESSSRASNFCLGIRRSEGLLQAHPGSAAFHTDSCTATQGTLQMIRPMVSNLMGTAPTQVAPTGGRCSGGTRWQKSSLCCSSV